MISIIGFLLFLAYTIIIFFIKEYYLLGLVFILNILLMIIFKINIKKVIISIMKLMPIIIFTTAINILISGISFGLLIGLRLILLCSMTYIYRKKTKLNEIQYVIETLLKPLKIIKINSKDIGIIVCIGISFIPILQREIIELKYSLESKGFKLNLKNIIRKNNYILIPLTTSVIKRVGEIENSLISKGYM